MLSWLQPQIAWVFLCLAGIICVVVSVKSSKHIVTYVRTFICNKFVLYYVATDSTTIHIVSYISYMYVGILV